MVDQLEEARVLAALASLRVPLEREVALAAGLTNTKRVAGSLAKADFGPAEPAALFRAPAG